MNALDGHGRTTAPPGYHGLWQAGVPSPEHGDGMVQLICDCCHATWVGLDGEACWWCARMLELMYEADKKRRHIT